MSGRFIVLEGVEGSGKSTQLPALAGWLDGLGHETVTTREPGGTVLGERVRALLLDRQQEDMHPDTELLLVFAARAEHCRRLIEPAIKRGAWVLSDRFTDATYAYQGGGRGIEASRIRALEEWVQDALRPDLVLVLDLAVDQGLSRIEKRGEPDRFESERRSFFERTRDVYLERARLKPDRYAVIDASGTVAEVQSDMRRAIQQRLGE